MSERKAPPPRLLNKQRSLSSDIERDEAWSRRRSSQRRLRRGHSVCVTDDDVEELKACFELGFGFDSNDVLDSKLTSAFPALGFYCAVNREYNNIMSRSSSSSSPMESPKCDSPSSVSTGSPGSIFEPGDDPKVVKTKIKKWAQVVACSVQQSSPTTRS
ncbi:hypothetical protein RJ639_047488 [Escallonia herrerae]|uniref:Uncharacterized protein n=1 Tax=Escallonia herrerae TaxID=1293975 RepID=A0AA88WHK5_9ASTE|nr:hypothetical protein RJ639_047488 [Escallonia herrerae]